MLDAPTPSRRDARADLDSPRRRARREAEAAALAQREAEAVALAHREAQRGADRQAQLDARIRQDLAVRHREAAAAALQATQELPVERQRSTVAVPAPAPSPAPSPRAAAPVTQAPAASRRTTSGAPLPWHLRRSFLLPVVAVCLLGSLSCLALVGLSYARVRASGGTLSDVVLSASDSHRAAAATTASSATTPAATTPVATTPAATPAPSTPAAAPSPVAPPVTQAPDEAGQTGTDGDAPEQADAGSAADSDRGTADDPGPTDGGSGASADGGAAQTVDGDVTYEGFGSAKAVSVDYTVDGEFDGTAAGGATFALPQEGSASWKSWYVAVTATDGGQVGCRIRDAGGKVLVESTAAAPGDTAECAWGDQGDGVPQEEDPASEDPGTS